MDAVNKYLDRWSSAVINRPATVKVWADKIKENQSRYQHVVNGTKIPWQFVGVIHYRESGLSFFTHLHNGDPLSARTVHVPKGRPLAGNPPFTWEESAIDSLILLKHLDKVEDWSIFNLLYQLEAYNGWGYSKYHPNVPSPYLWSYTQFYTKGKYMYDGKFNPELIDKQIGCVPLLKLLL